MLLSLSHDAVSDFTIPSRFSMIMTRAACSNLAAKVSHGQMNSLVLVPTLKPMYSTLIVLRSNLFNEFSML